MSDIEQKRLYPKFSVSIRGRKWQIYMVSKAEMQMILGEEEEAMGLTIARNRRIYLQSGQSYEELCDSFMHEWGHACAGNVLHSTHGSEDNKIATLVYEEMICESVGDAGQELLEQAGMILAELRKVAVKKDDTLEAHKV